MIFTFKQLGFIQWLFNEPDKDKYIISSDLSIDNDLSWLSHKEDAKNLAMDYKQTRQDLNKAFKEYKKTV